MSLRQVDEIETHAVWVLVDRWHVDEQAATAALDNAAVELGVGVHDLAALVVAGAPHLHAVQETPVEPEARESGHRIVYGRRERPLVEVRAGGNWYRGRLCSQIERADGWWLYVTYYLPEHRTARHAKFAAHDVRPVTLLPQGAPNNPGPNGPDEPHPTTIRPRRPNCGLMCERLLLLAGNQRRPVRGVAAELGWAPRYTIKSPVPSHSDTANGRTRHSGNDC